MSNEVSASAAGGLVMNVLECTKVCCYFHLLFVFYLIFIYCNQLIYSLVMILFSCSKMAPPCDLVPFYSHLSSLLVPSVSAFCLAMLPFPCQCIDAFCLCFVKNYKHFFFLK